MTLATLFGLPALLVALPIVSLSASAFVVAIAVRWLRRSRHTDDRFEGPPFTPPVSILKPLKGIDDDLEANLESFYGLDYPALQILLGVADPDDPALFVARAVAARHPEIETRVVVGEGGTGRNPKVRLLSAMLPHVRHEILLISDSNVRAHPGYLRRTVAAMRPPEVGLVSNPVVGVGEESAAAAMENLHLSAFVATINIAAHALAGYDVAVGKSMLLRRTALRAMGGLRAVRSVLAEDQIIAAKVREAGWEVRLAPEPVHNANRTWSLRCFTERHARWARIRLRLAPWSYPLEIAGNPLAMALVAILLGAPHPLTLLAGTLVAKTTLDALATYALRGEAVPPRYLLLGPIKDLLLIGVWLVPFASRRVRWRGNTLRISRGTRVTTPKVYTRSRAIRWARRRHRALRHIRNHGRHARRVSSSLRSHRRHRRGARWGSAGST